VAKNNHERVNGKMNVPVEGILIFVTAWLGVQSWTLMTIVKLMGTVAALKQQLSDCKDACKVVKIAKKLDEL
jgi:hypothetical protein